MARLEIRNPVEVSTFRTSDGSTWDNLQIARRHEASLGLKKFLEDNRMAYGEWSTEQVYEFMTEHASVLHDTLGLMLPDSE
jgi:hypothetical protein